MSKTTTPRRNAWTRIKADLAGAERRAAYHWSAVVRLIHKLQLAHARIRELEARVAEQEAIIAEQPRQRIAPWDSRTLN